MIVRCPNCRAEYALADALADQDLRAVIRMMPDFAGHQKIVSEYVEMLHRDLWIRRHGRTLRLFSEVREWFVSGAFTFRRTRYEISPAGIAAAMRSVVGRRFESPLTNHNYLKQVMIPVSERERQAKSIEEERLRRAAESAGFRRLAPPRCDDHSRQAGSLTEPLRDQLDALYRKLGTPPGEAAGTQRPKPLSTEERERAQAELSEFRARMEKSYDDRHD